MTKELNLLMRQYNNLKDQWEEATNKLKLDANERQTQNSIHEQQKKMINQ